MVGDILARGGKSAIFPPAKVTAEKWAAIWDEPKPEKEKPAKKKQPKLKTNWSR